MNKKNRKFLIIGASCLSLVAVPTLIFTACNTNTQNVELLISNSGINNVAVGEIVATYTNNEIKDNGIIFGSGLNDVTGVVTFKKGSSDSDASMQFTQLSFTAEAESDITLKFPDVILSSDKSNEYKITEVSSPNLIAEASRPLIKHIIIGSNITKLQSGTFSLAYDNVVSVDFLSTKAPFIDASEAQNIFKPAFGFKDVCKFYVPCNITETEYTSYSTPLENVKQNGTIIALSIKSVSIDSNKTVIRAGSDEKIKLDLIFTSRQNEKIKFSALEGNNRYQQTIVWANNNADLCSLTAIANNPSVVEFSPTKNKEMYGTAIIGATVSPIGASTADFALLAIKNITVQAGSGGIDTNLSMIIGGSIIGAMVLIGVGTYTFFWWKKNKAKSKDDVAPPGETKKGGNFTMTMNKMKDWFKNTFKSSKCKDSACKDSACKSTAENEPAKKAK